MGSPGFLRKKPCSMVIEQRGKSQYQMDETLVYMEQEVTFLAPSTACRYLGVWATPTGDMSNTKERIFKRTEEARDLLRHHPLTPEREMMLFIGTRFSNLYTTVHPPA